MRRVMVSYIAAALVVAAMFCPVNAQIRDVSVTAMVSRVVRGEFPEVKVWLSDVSGSPKGMVGRSIVVKPYYVRDRKGRPSLTAAATRANLVTRGLLPGDRITGRLMAKTQVRGVYTITDVKRLPCKQPAASAPATKGMELRTDLAEYPAGKPVRIELVVVNSTNRDMEFTFSSGQQFDFWVTRNSAQVWTWSRGKFFTQALTHLKLAPGQSKTFSASWNQQGNDGKQVPAGSYVVSGRLTTMGERPPVASKTIGVL